MAFFYRSRGFIITICSLANCEQRKLLLLVLFGALNIYLALRKYPRSDSGNFQLIIGSLIVFFSLVNSPALWLMAVFAILFIGLKGVEISGIDLTKNTFWQKETDDHGTNRSIKNT